MKVEEYKDELIDVCVDTIKMGKQAIVFMNSKKSAEKQSEELSKFIRKKDVINLENNDKLDLLAKEILGSSPTKQCKRLSNIIKGGVAFHHSGLKPFQRDLIEDKFRSNEIKIIFSTPTLAAGVNLPAYRTIIHSLRRFNGISGRMDYIPTLEYLQMAGRAGRPDFGEKFGESIILLRKQKEEIVMDKYIYGMPEKITSKLGVEPILRFQILSLTSFMKTKKKLRDFFLNTFYGFQFGDEEYLEYMINKIISDLEMYGLLEQENESVFQTRIGESVSKLYLDPITANKFITFLKRTMEEEEHKELNEFSILQLICNTFEMRPYIRPKNKKDLSISYEEHEKNILQEIPDVFDVDFDEFFKSLNVALILEEWMNEKDEEFLYENYNVTPGDLNNKLYNGDWMLYSLQELARLVDNRKVFEMISDIRIRLKYGIKKELLDLVKIRGIGKVKARRLFRQGIKNKADMDKYPEKSKEIIGKKTTKKIVSKSPETKLQKSIFDF